MFFSALAAPIILKRSMGRSVGLRRTSVQLVEVLYYLIICLNFEDMHSPVVEVALQEKRK